MLPYRNLGEVKCADCGALVDARKLYFHYETPQHIDAVLRQYTPEYLKRITDAGKSPPPKQKGR